MNRRGKRNKRQLIDVKTLKERNRELESSLSNHEAARTAFEKSDALLRKIFLTIPDVFAVIDRNYRILICNWQGGFEPESGDVRDAVPYCYKVFHDRQTPCDSCHVMEVFMTGTPLVREKLNPRIGYVEIRAYPVFDEAGDVAMVAESVRDITECKRAETELRRYHDRLEELVRERTFMLDQTNESLRREIDERREIEEALRESEEKFRVLAETSPAMIFLFQGERHLYVNPAAEQLTGYTQEELLNMRFWDWLHDDYKDLVRSRGLARLQGAQPPGKYEFRYVTREGEERWGLLSVGKIDYRGSAAGIGTIVDINELKSTEMKLRAMNEELKDRTDQLQNAQQELVRREKLATIGRLAGSVGHELRNPLAVMNNALFFLKSVLADAGEPVGEYLDIIKKEIDNSRRIITDLLDFARTREPLTTIVTARELIGDILRKCPLPPNIQILNEIPDTLPSLAIDPMQIGQVFQNLIVNAVEAMPDGGVLRVSARVLPGTRFEEQGSGKKDISVVPLNMPPDTDTVFGADFIEINVADTGVGIFPENMNNLFQPLFTTKAKGIGLGLTVCRNLTEANGGRISVESRPGAGTTFSVTLPAAAHGAVG